MSLAFKEALIIIWLFINIFLANLAFLLSFSINYNMVIYKHPKKQHNNVS